MLLAQGADPNSADSRGYMPLHMAAQEGRLGVVRTLVGLGADVNKADRDGESPLFYAVGCGHPRVVGFLLESGSNANARTRYDDRGTPLHRAAAWDQVAAARVLIRHGARIDALDQKGRKPIAFARRRKNQRMVEFLIAAEVASKPECRRKRTMHQKRVQRP